MTAADNTTFLNESVDGGSVTAYNSSGQAANIQFRWVKVDSASQGSGHTDKWEMFYQTDSKASGSGVEWKNVGTDFTFDSAGKLTSPTSSNISIAPKASATICLKTCKSLTCHANPAVHLAPS